MYSSTMARETEVALLRIGELSRRVGVSTHVLRAWESRYGLLRPERTAGGFRLYSEHDAARVRSMQQRLATGLSAAEAARAVLSEESTAPAATAEPTGAGGTAAAAAVVVDEGGVEPLRRELAAALDDLDEPAAQAVLDRLVSELTVETVLRDVLLPYLHELGERWACGEVSVTQEHFASNLVRDRLTGLARGWGNPRGPKALLACAPGELHDLGLMMFGVALRRQGWQVGYLGADTPVAALRETAERLGPALVVVAAVHADRFAAAADDLADLAARTPLAIAGAGADREAAHRITARLLDGDPVSAARGLAR